MTVFERYLGAIACIWLLIFIGLAIWHSSKRDAE
jgi:hypothetical protein